MSEQNQPSQQQPSEKHDDASRVVLLVVGAVLVFVGLVLLGRQWFWPFLQPFSQAWDLLRGLGWGLGLIIIGVLVIVLTQRKGFTPPAKGARLYRSRKNKMVAGVFGGLAEYLSMDVTVLRLVFAALAILFDVWPAIVAYVVAVIIVPEEPKERPATAAAVAPPAPVPPAAPTAAPVQPPTPPSPPTPVEPSPEGSDADVADD